MLPGIGLILWGHSPRRGDRRKTGKETGDSSVCPRFPPTNMSYLLLFISGMFGLLDTGVFTAQAAAFEGLCCAEELPLPKYPILARQARLAGVVSVEVNLGQNDAPITSIYSSAAPLFRDAVKLALEGAKFSNRCRYPVKIDFIFEMDVGRKATTSDDGSITVRPPGSVLIKAAPFPMSGETGGKNGYRRDVSGHR